MKRKLIKLINTSKIGFPYDKAIRPELSSAAFAKIGPENVVIALVIMLLNGSAWFSFAIKYFCAKGFRENAFPSASTQTKSKTIMCW